MLSPNKDEYKVGETVNLNCMEAGLRPLPRGSYRCGDRFKWEPPLPADIRCTAGTVHYSYELPQSEELVINFQIQYLPIRRSQKERESQRKGDSQGLFIEYILYRLSQETKPTKTGRHTKVFCNKSNKIKESPLVKWHFCVKNDLHLHIAAKCNVNWVWIMDNPIEKVV